MTSNRIFTGELKDRPGQRFFVVADDETDAGRFVVAALGQPARLALADASGLVVAARDGARQAEVVLPLRFAGVEALSPGAW